MSYLVRYSGNIIAVAGELARAEAYVRSRLADEDGVSMGELQLTRTEHPDGRISMSGATGTIIDLIPVQQV